MATNRSTPRPRVLRPAGALPPPSAGSTVWREVYDEIDDGAGHVFPFSQICDPEKAQAWIDRLAVLCSPETEWYARDYGVGVPEQWRRQQDVVRQAWEAVRNVYLALNLPPGADAELLAIRRQWVGVISARMRQFAADAGYDLSDGSSGCVTDQGYWPYMLDWNADLKTGSPTGQDHCGHWGMPPLPPHPDGKDTTPEEWARQLGSRSFQFRCDDVNSVDWATIRYNEAGFTVGLRADRRGANPCKIIGAPPLYWFYEWARDVSRMLSARGAIGSIRALRLGIVAKNVAEAVWSGAVNDQNDPDGKLRQQAAAVAAQGYVALAETDDGKKLLGGFALAAAAANVIPVYGQTVSAVIAAYAALLAVTPLAIGYFADEYGRRRPVYEVPWLTATRDGVPTHGVPDPEGFDRASIHLAGEKQRPSSAGSGSSPRSLPVPSRKKPLSTTFKPSTGSGWLYGGAALVAAGAAVGVGLALARRSR